jgi:hypothetical protein
MNENGPSDKNAEIIRRREKFAAACSQTLEGQEMTPEELAKLELNQLLAQVLLQLKETSKLPGIFGQNLDARVLPILEKMETSENRIAEKAAAKVLERLPVSKQKAPAPRQDLTVVHAGLAIIVVLLLADIAVHFHAVS